MRSQTLLLMLGLVCACPGDKDDDTGAEATDPGSSGASTGEPTTSDEPTTGGPAACADFTDEASCNAAPSALEIVCEWHDVQQLTLDMCALGGTAGRCLEISVNDGGCTECIYKDLGGGQFEFAKRGVNAYGCQLDAEFSSCSGFGDDPPVCDCICPAMAP